MRIAARLKGMWVLTLILGLFATTGARAAVPPPPADLVKGDLVAATASIAPGATLWVALHLEIKPGWHIYWRNPGARVFSVWINNQQVLGNFDVFAAGGANNAVDRSFQVSSSGTVTIHMTASADAPMISGIEIK